MKFKQALEKARYIFVWCPCRRTQELCEITKIDANMLADRTNAIFKYNDRTKVLVIGKGG